LRDIEIRSVATARRLREAEQADRTLQWMTHFYGIARKRSVFEHSLMNTEADRRRASETIPPVAMPPSLVARPLSLLDASDEEFRAERNQFLDRLDLLKADLGDGSTAADFQRVRTLLSRVLDWPPTDRIVREFVGHAGALIRRTRLNQASARAELEALAQQSRRIGGDLSRSARSPGGLPGGAGGGPSATAAQR
jgi:hypothetical protein